MVVNWNLVFDTELTPSDPQKCPVTIIGLRSHIQTVGYDNIKAKLEPRVDEKIFKLALENLQESVCPLYMNNATLSLLPIKCSRHNTPSRAHALTKAVRNCIGSVPGCALEYVLIVCEKRNVFASACAVARALPLYTRKTTPVATERDLYVEFILTGKEQLVTEDIECLQACCHAIRKTARIVDMPCNEMNTDDFLQEVGSVGMTLGITPEIIQGEALKERGFGGIYGVGKAALHLPALAVLSHCPEGAEHTVAWVGKGIVYDTGGLSIKGKTSMPGMKRDCGGAAAVLAAFECAIKLGFKQNLHAVLCLAENAVGPLATRPDDIHTLYSGRTVEINNTDAEGRLVLADGVVYAQKDLKANIILDMATLTGAQSVATGKYHGAVITNNEEWEVKSLAAGKVSGDLLFPLPYCPELHFSEYTSAVADMKNSVADRSNALTSCAALFVAGNLGFDYPGAWIHIDMAAPVHCGERATGYGVALLETLFGHWSSNPMLRQAGREMVETNCMGNGDASNDRNPLPKKRKA